MLTKEPYRVYVPGVQEVVYRPPESWCAAAPVPGNPSPPPRGGSDPPVTYPPPAWCTDSLGAGTGLPPCPK